MRYEDNLNPKQITTIPYREKTTVFPIDGMSLSGKGILDYRFGGNDEGDSVVIVSVEATHNDKYILVVFGFIIAWLGDVILKFINVTPAWNTWIPEWILKWFR